MCKCKYMRKKGLFWYCSSCGILTFPCDVRHPGCMYFVPSRKKDCPFWQKGYCKVRSAWVHCKGEHFRGCHYYRKYCRENAQEIVDDGKENLL